MSLYYIIFYIHHVVTPSALDKWGFCAVIRRVFMAKESILVAGLTATYFEYLLLTLQRLPCVDASALALELYPIQKRGENGSDIYETYDTNLCEIQFLLHEDVLIVLI